jgi:hypothetical protein
MILRLADILSDASHLMQLGIDRFRTLIRPSHQSIAIGRIPFIIYVGGGSALHGPIAVEDDLIPIANVSRFGKNGGFIISRLLFFVDDTFLILFSIHDAFPLGKG